MRSAEFIIPTVLKSQLEAYLMFVIPYMEQNINDTVPSVLLPKLKECLSGLEALPAEIVER